MKKREKGFTLIELLAVIVILAVIALIAVPLILSLVNKSRMKAAEESAILYVDTIENTLMINNVENTDGKTYKVKGRTVVDEKDEVVLNLEIKGDVPYSGVNNEIKINSGFIETANLRFNSYYVHYEMDMTTKKFKTCTSQKGFLDTCDGTGSITPSVPDLPKENPSIEIAKDKTYLAVVYLDPTNLSKKCTKEEAEKNVNEYGTPTMITSGCMKWYAYKEDENNYTMILDHNTTIGVRWDQEVGTTELDKRFSSDVKDWEDKIKETARFISADEIAELTGANREDTIKWHSSKKFSTSLEINMDTEASSFYLDGSGNSYSNTDGWKRQVATTSGSSKYAWLYDYMESCTGDKNYEYGCNIADNHIYIEANNSSDSCSIHKWNGCRNVLYYWLLNEFNNDLTSSYVVSRTGMVTYGSSLKLAGIRPVITVSKALFNK